MNEGVIKVGPGKAISRGGWSGRGCFGNLHSFSTVYARVSEAEQRRRNTARALETGELPALSHRLSSDHSETKKQV